jgi:hypothetical protein
MSKRTALKAVLKLVERGPGHSTLFYWMLDNHDALLRVWPRSSIRWSVLCDEFAELGLTDINGKPASEETARITWWRVRKAAQEAKDHQKFGIKPARDRARAPMTQPWRATGGEAQSQARAVPSPGSVHATAPIPAPASSADTMQEIEGPVPPDVAQARIAALQKKLNARSGR